MCYMTTEHNKVFGEHLYLNCLATPWLQTFFSPEGTDYKTLQCLHHTLLAALNLYSCLIAKLNIKHTTNKIKVMYTASYSLHMAQSIEDNYCSSTGPNCIDYYTIYNKTLKVTYLCSSLWTSHNVLLHQRVFDTHYSKPGNSRQVNT